MNKTKKLFRTIFEFLIFILILGFVITELMGTTYAVTSLGNPDVTITIDENGHITQQGNLFGDDQWYPDEKGRDGIIRIYNNYRSTKLTSLGVLAELNSYRNGYTEADIYQSFIQHMRLTIKKGRWFQFGDTSIISDRSISELLYTPEQNDSYNGIVLDINDQLSISASNPLDLKYTLRMDEDAGNELQSLSANVSFIIKTPIDSTNDNPTPGVGSNSGGENNTGGNVVPTNNPSTNEVIQPLVEEPIIKIPDINGHWAYDCIVTLIDKKIIQGDDKGRIRPDDYITRAEAAVLVGKALKLNPKDTSNIKYKDIIPKWAQGYVNITSEENIYRGYPNGQFKPSNSITREEMIAVLTRAFKLSLDDKSLVLPFDDKNKIGAWSEENIKAGYEDKVIEGYPDNTYRPQNKITRAEAFTIICKLLEYHETHLKKLQ